MCVRAAPFSWSKRTLQNRLIINWSNLYALKACPDTRTCPRDRYRVLIMRPDIQIRRIYQIYRSVAAGSHRKYKSWIPRAVISCIYFFCSDGYVIFALILTALRVANFFSSIYFVCCTSTVRKLLLIYIFIHVFWFFLDKLSRICGTNTLQVE